MGLRRTYEMVLTYPALEELWLHLEDPVANLNPFAACGARFYTDSGTPHGPTTELGDFNLSALEVDGIDFPADWAGPVFSEGGEICQKTQIEIVLAAPVVQEQLYGLLLIKDPGVEVDFLLGMMRFQTQDGEDDPIIITKVNDLVSVDVLVPIAHTVIVE